jgi:hypothetical protein
MSLFLKLIYISIAWVGSGNPRCNIMSFFPFPFLYSLYMKKKHEKNSLAADMYAFRYIHTGYYKRILYTRILCFFEEVQLIQRFLESEVESLQHKS